MGFKYKNKVNDLRDQKKIFRMRHGSKAQGDRRDFAQVLEEMSRMRKALEAELQELQDM